MRKKVLLVLQLFILAALAAMFTNAFIYDGGPTTDTFQPTIHIEGDVRASDGDALYREDDRVMGVKQYPFRMVAIYNEKIVGSGGAYPLTYSLNLFTQLTTLNLWDKDIELYYGVYDETEPQRAKLIYCTTINLQKQFGNFERREVWIDIMCVD